MNLENVDYLKLYEHLKIAQIKQSASNANQYTGLCPFHNDTERSFAFNTSTGMWQCFKGCGNGNIITFIAKKYQVINDDATSILKAILEPVEADYIKFHNTLLASPTVLKVFMQERGLTLETIKEYKIGYEGERFTIPIFIKDVLVNIRYYKLGKTKMKFFSYSKKVKKNDKEETIGYGDRKLYPYASMFNGDDIFIFEGEMDCLRALDVGLNAITNTTGAGSFNKNWGYLFVNKNVYICYDIDKAGKDGAEKTAFCLKDYAKKIQIINLPLTEPKNADFTDYMLNHSVEDFKSLLQDSRPLSQQTSLDITSSGSTDTGEKKLSNTTQTEIKEREAIVKTTLRESSKPSLKGKKIQLQIVVSGKDLTPFTIPYKIRAACQLFNPEHKDLKKRCHACFLSTIPGSSIDKTLTVKDSVLLKLIMSNDFQNKGYLREFVGIPKICNQFKLDVLENQNVEEIRAIPEIDFIDEKDSEYTARTIYHCSTTGKRLRSNTSYSITGYSTTKPDSQYATIVFDKAEHKQTDIDSFVMTDKIKKSLSVFTAEEGKVEEKINHIHEIFTYDITKIYGREDLLVALDWVWFSVLEFNFLNSLERRGYTEGLIIGDTETGKSKTIEAIRQHYKLGELISGKGATPAGLIGGLSAVANRWHLQWGKIPLNDRKLLAIDEFGGLSEETIAALTNVRSSGIAEIVRIITERTHARVRLIASANPRAGDKVNNYNYGILIVKNLIGKTEDVRRFDFALILAESDVDLTLLDLEELSKMKIKNPYTSELNNLLLRWTWSRTRENIVFTPGATTLILKLSNQLSLKYSSSIPLVAQAEQRIKVARLAVATATRVFSTDESGNNVIIKEEHVQFVYDFLQKIYDKPAMGYDLYSKSQHIKTNITERELDKLIMEFKAQFPWKYLRDVLLDSRYFGKGELLDMTGMDPAKGKEFFKWCNRNRLVRGISGKFKATPIFIKMLKHKDILNAKDEHLSQVPLEIEPEEAPKDKKPKPKIEENEDLPF